MEFANYLRYCKDLRFEDKPDYSYLRHLFRTLFHSQGFTYDYVFDWNMLKFGNTRQPPLPSTQQQHVTIPAQAVTLPAAVSSGVNIDQEHRSRLESSYVSISTNFYLTILYNICLSSTVCNNLLHFFS